MLTRLAPCPISVRSWRSLCSGILALALSVALGGANAGKKPAAYTYYSVGNPQASVSAGSPTFPSYVLMGGGLDVDEAFRWMITRAGIKPGTGGRLVVIRTTGDGAYDPYIYYSNKKGSIKSSDIVAGWVGGASLGLTSVETLVIPGTTAANDTTVNAIVAKANIVWIAGGDQSTYIKFWKGQTLETTLNTLIAKNVPIGGTSAGLAVLGGFDYSALNLSVTSQQALLNPYHPDITFDPNPLSTSGGFIAPAVFKNTIMDSHLDERDRMGRLVAFVARLNTTCPGGVLNNQAARGIGVGVQTALLVEGNGTSYTGKRVTNKTSTTPSAVYFVRETMAPTRCVADQPLEIPTSSIEIQKLGINDTAFDLTNWQGVMSPLPTNMVYTTGGVLYPNPYPY